MLLFCVSAMNGVLASHLVTSKVAPVRADSLSSSDIIARIQGGTALKLLDEDRLYGTGYWKIELPEGGIGYVYKTHVRYMDAPLPGSELEDEEPASGFLQVHMINVGQADALYVVCPDGNHQMIIDAGELNFRHSGSLNEFRNYISAFHKKNDPIELVVTSHPHADHLAGMEWLLKNYEVDMYLDNGKKSTSTSYKSLEATVLNQQISRKRLTDVELPQVEFCSRTDVKLTILRPIGFDDEDMKVNDYSIILRMDYKGASFLFTGDAEKELEKHLLADPSITPYLDVDWLKVSHHGSDTSTGKAFVEAVTPDIAAISSGSETVKPNDNHRHPRMVTLANLLPYVSNRSGVTTTLEGNDSESKKWDQITTKAAIYITSNDGDLVFLSDGNSIWKLGDKAN